jgi:hypothetical protein
VVDGIAEANKRRPNDSVSTSTLLIVVQFAVALEPAVHTVTLAIGALARLNWVTETSTGTVFAALLAVGTALGFAELSVLVAAGVVTEVLLLVLLVLLVVLVVGEVDEEPPPPPPQAARLVRSAVTSAHAMVRMMLIRFIAGRPG